MVLADHLKDNELPAGVFPPEVERTFGCSCDRFVPVLQAKSGRES